MKPACRQGPTKEFKDNPLSAWVLPLHGISYVTNKIKIIHK